MGELKDKAAGYTNDAIGNAKQAIGRATGKPALEQEGREQEARGEAQKLAGEVKGALGDRV
jgi:uncharacterized protein YjbJ (UPF0337 family)